MPRSCLNQTGTVLDENVWSGLIAPVVLFVTIQGLACGANLWFGGLPYPVNPGRPEWSKVQTRGKPLVATAQAKYMSAGEQ